MIVTIGRLLLRQSRSFFNVWREVASSPIRGPSSLALEFFEFLLRYLGQFLQFPQAGRRPRRLAPRTQRSDLPRCRRDRRVTNIPSESHVVALHSVGFLPNLQSSGFLMRGPR
jgi:hypothetical protein